MVVLTNPSNFPPRDLTYNISVFPVKGNGQLLFRFFSSVMPCQSSICRIEQLHKITLLEIPEINQIHGFFSIIFLLPLSRDFKKQLQTLQRSLRQIKFSIIQGHGNFLLSIPTATLLFAAVIGKTDGLA